MPQRNLLIPVPVREERKTASINSTKPSKTPFISRFACQQMPDPKDVGVISISLLFLYAHPHPHLHPYSQPHPYPRCPAATSIELFCTAVVSVDGETMTVALFLLRLDLYAIFYDLRDGLRPQAQAHFKVIFGLASSPFGQLSCQINLLARLMSWSKSIVRLTGLNLFTFSKLFC